MTIDRRALDRAYVRLQFSAGGSPLRGHRSYVEAIVHDISHWVLLGNAELPPHGKSLDAEVSDHVSQLLYTADARNDHEALTCATEAHAFRRLGLGWTREDSAALATYAAKSMLHFVKTTWDGTDVSSDFCARVCGTGQCDRRSIDPPRLARSLCHGRVSRE